MAKGSCQECGKPNVNLRKIGKMQVCAGCVNLVRSRQFREGIQAQQKNLEAQQKKEFYTKRIEIAQRGKAAYEAGNVVEALRSYLLYIDVTEDGHKCGEGGLSPSLYNPKFRDQAAEMLLVAVIYWDMAKIYDKIPTKRKEFKQAIAKVDQFTYGMPYQALISETVKKYVASKRAQNVKDFELLFEHLKPKKKCYVVSEIYGDTEHPNVLLLRNFRDNFLNKSLIGRLFIFVYYFSQPVIEPIVKASPWLRAKIKGVIEKIINEYFR